MITWGLPVYLDLWFAGMAAGAYLTAFLAERFGNHSDHRLLHTALYVGIPAAMAGVGFLLIDLSYPLRFWHLFINFNLTSPMSIGSWLITLWIGTSMLILFLWHLRKRLPIRPARLQWIMNKLHWAGLFASVILMSYTGVLLASSSQPLWASTVLLPPLFVVSATSTGAAVLIIIGLISRMWKIYGDTIRRMVQVVTVVIIIELVLLGVYFLMLSRSGVPGAIEAMSQLTTGTLALPFWIGVVLLAILLPFVLFIVNWSKKAGEQKVVFFSSIASSVFVVSGGLVLRFVIVLGGQL
jgi:formate-dependent nitrite reductase membrane component NrfD